MSKQWKAVTIDWAALALQADDDQCVICISTREAAILKALLITAYWTTRWDNLGETRKTLNERMARLDARLDVCTNVGGESWITIKALNELFRQLFKSLWVDSPTDINPDAPTVTWNTDDTDDRNAALCMACMALVDTICAMEAQQLAWRYAGVRLVFAVLKILISSLTAFGVLVSGELIAELGYETAMEALEDRQARLDVACCMLAALTGEAVTEEVLSESLDGCGFGGGTNEAIVRDYVHQSIQSTDTYYAMIDAAGKAFVQVSVLGLNLCECGDCGIVTFDSPVGDLSYVVLFGSITGDGNPGQCGRGTVYVDEEPWPDADKFDIEIELPELQTVSGLSFDYNWYIEDAPSGIFGFWVELRDSSHEVIDDWDYASALPQQSWEHYKFSETPVANVKYVWLRLWLTCACPNEKDIRLDNIRVWCE